MPRGSGKQIVDVDVQDTEHDKGFHRSESLNPATQLHRHPFDESQIRQTRRQADDHAEPDHRVPRRMVIEETFPTDGPGRKQISG